MINNEILWKRKYKNTSTGLISDNLLDVFNGNEISLESLKWFFELGYIPGKETLFKNIEKVKYDLFENSQIEINTEKYLNYDYNDLVKIGKEKICQSISESIQNSSRSIILPLTSGLDSRIILGGLMENVSTDKIRTITWGTPEGIDCKVGAMMSKKNGIEHHLMNLKKYELTRERLFNFAVNSDFSVPLFDHWPVDWVKELINNLDGSLWMGLLGGTISGSNLPNSLAENPYSYFLSSNRRLNSLSSVSASLLGEMPEIKDLQNITKYIKKPTQDSLDIQLHHIDLISPTKIHKDFFYEFPYMNSEVISFFLSIPHEYRKGRSIFKDIILKQFKHLGKFPSNRSGKLPLDLHGKKRTVYKKIRNLAFKPKYLEVKGSGKYLDFRSSINREVETLFKESLKDIEASVDITRLNLIKKEFFKDNKHDRLMDAIVSLYIYKKRLGI